MYKEDKLKIIIGSEKSFKLEDQIKFGELSGDLNPIHIDPIHARRTIYGECIVHGVHILMYAMDCLSKYNGLHIEIFNVKFLKPLPLNVKIQVELDINKSKIEIFNNSVIYCIIKFKYGHIEINNNNFHIKSNEKLKNPSIKSFEECSISTKEEIIYRENISLNCSMFPYLYASYGRAIASDLAATSEIVGMQNPGLNSLFLSIDAKIQINKSNYNYYEVSSSDKRFSLINIHFNGLNLKANLKILYRNTHASNQSIYEISKLTKTNEFEKINALIIGGTRGIGEITAKIISSAGGAVTISYNLGLSEALKLKKEFTEFGNPCDIINIDILKNIVFKNKQYNQIYYFATPKIKSENDVVNHKKLAEIYDSYYVHGFKKIIKSIRNKKINTSIFYPSTQYAINPPKNYRDYASSKIRGETLCSNLIEKGIKIHIHRLPKLATDQTLSIINDEDLIDTFKVMYPIIKEMLLDLNNFEN